MVDARDGKFYKISKLADGNCWMVSNLALDGMDGLGAVRTLTTSDSNVTTSRTLATNIANGTISNFDDIQIFSDVADRSTTNCDTLEYCVTSDDKFGNYYNFMAATAGLGTQAAMGTIEESVCPKGWRLPDATGDISYVSLLGKYGLPTTNYYVGDSGLDPQSFITLQKAPLHFVLAGEYSNQDGVAYPAKLPHSWGTYITRHASETYNTLRTAFYFDVRSSYSIFAPLHEPRKHWGYSVRCVFGS